MVVDDVREIHVVVLLQHQEVDDCSGHDGANEKRNSEGGGGAHEYDPTAISAG